MPARRKSETELALSGALQNHPQRYANRFQPVTAPARIIGRPPAHYAVAQRAAWAEIVRTSPEGFLTRHDRLAVEVTVALLLKIRSGTAKTADVSALTVLLAKLAMTPADRKRLNYETPAPSAPVPPGESDPWAAFSDSET